MAWTIRGWKDFEDWFNNFFGFGRDKDATGENAIGVGTGSTSLAGDIASGGSAGAIYDDLTGRTAAADQYNYNLALQHDAQMFNSAEAQKQRDFQLMMSNTAYQRGVQDLQAAGLNPWLAVQGSGAPVSSGSSASSSVGGSSTQRDSGLKMVSDAIGSALSVALIAKVIKYIGK